MVDYSISKLLNSQGLLTCSVCGEEFEPNDDTKYIISGGYTCSWKCFLNEVKRRQSDTKKEDRQEKRRHRKE